MQRRRTAAGREEQLAALGTARQEAAAGGRFVLVTGEAGSGRSTLLDAAADAWAAEGAVVLRVPHPDGDDSAAGYAALLHAVREQYERLADPQLAGLLSAIGRLTSAGAPDGHLATLAQETSAAFGLIGRRVPTVVIADDADDAPGLTAALAAAVRDGCLVAASARAAEGRLAALAGTVVPLPPLPAAAIREMLCQRHGAPLDEAVLPALRGALGSLAGHPATVLQTADALVRTGRLRVVRGHLCLVDPLAPIALPAEHPIVVALHARGPVAVRLATMAAVTRFGLDDLELFADATLGRLDRYGWVLDALAADGTLVATPQGSFRPRSAALAARLVEDAGPAAAARLHRAYAAAMFRRAGAGVPADQATLADHVTSAGVAMPTDRGTGVSLAATAAAATDREPDRAADWLRAALWHTGGGRAADDILARLLRLLVRTGRFGQLAEVVQAAGPAAHRGGDLAAAAALAALHTGTPVPGDATGPLALAHGWLTGAPCPATVTTSSTLVTADEFTRAAHAAGAGTDADDLLVAGTHGDLAEILRLVLGEQRYGVPADGPLAAYHRLHLAYARGDLPGLLSAARSADLTGGDAPAVRRLARLWGAEALGLQGRPDEAASWIASVPDEAPYAALRWWAANGPVGEPQSAGDAADRLAAAHTALARQLAHGSRIGTEQLVVRATVLAVRFGLSAEAAAWREVAEAPGRCSTETALVVRALATADAAAADRAAELLRARDHRCTLAQAGIALARVSAEPRRRLLEAQSAADAIGSPWLRSAVTAAMREHGVRRPRSRSTQDAFSAVEMQIIELIRRGRTNRQIAVQVRMSEKTIENYLTRLFARTGCRSRVELAAASLTPDFLGASS
ncbi:helix-turn-helix transcriptional regulator [Catenuloplanes atrovinosus]|uniref:DNA-binding CsgD family transcriptional regulator/energy-coupling factor transporter ATP-binding protein EcfA2 n=1 Tax=Catenuloplanes atrovinosus TaxID=137266 RepID=A0AAE3YLW4_9ACTN|nr:AAA family ATPase [Catenuloplanes atrovinosus]MDR7274251.1 DNA-binding CsgD family transcriptional regulator/energy-coupling factor transporter ATP-binding protein EcfA2 [Catenuloplanes atrovinosus]